MHSVFVLNILCVLNKYNSIEAPSKKLPSDVYVATLRFNATFSFKLTSFKQCLFKQNPS